MYVSFISNIVEDNLSLLRVEFKPKTIGLFYS